jgi:formylglycine-generating enzyme required for sulfatase activity
MSEELLHLRIFLSSPGDVPAERKIALEVIELLQYESQFKDSVFLEVVAWDKPGAGTPMLANKSPQAAIDAGLAMPAECDIVIVIFWARVGTPLPFPEYKKENGEPYYSGTVWEFDNAMEASRLHGRPEVVVYRCTEKVLLDDDAPDFEQILAQKKLVRKFFDQFADAKTGANLGGINCYQKPEDFRRDLTVHLRKLAEKLKLKRSGEPAPYPSGSIKSALPRQLPDWPGSPFPGLRAFNDKDAPIFFGRGAEIDKLTDRINRNRFVTVVGASGSGKSSLVWAGLIPRLKANGIKSDHTASGDWLWRRLTPGGVNDNPFLALAVELKPYLPGLGTREIAQKLAGDPKALTKLIPQILRGRPNSSELLLFIDQLEELVTMVSASYRAPFAEMLWQAVAGERFRIVATLRADFYHQLIPISGALVQLLQNGSYPLGAPDPLSLQEMIVRPAERAGLRFEENLARSILDDTGMDPGALALMAYLLDELYRRRTADGRLTRQAYDGLGGVAGAIGKRAEQIFETLSPRAQAVLPHVFRRLVEVDEHGTATRQRALQDEIERSIPGEPTKQLLAVFTRTRLLVSNEQEGRRNIEVAHEALLRKWDRLADWINLKQDDLRLLRQVKLAAAEWDQNARQRAFRWADERLKPVYAMIQRLEVNEEHEFNAAAREFIRRESDRLLDEIGSSDTTHIRRSSIGERLCVIGDTRPGVGLRPDGLPDIDWCKVESADGRLSVDVEIEGIGKVKVNLPFCIARYPVTLAQFQAFIEAPDGYYSSEINWFEGLAAHDKDRQLDEQRFKISNYPRETVNWYQAVAFCRWLSWRLDAMKDRESGSERKASILTNPTTSMSRSKPGESGGFDLLNPFTWAVRLATEAEWQFAAAGPSAKVYPWGSDWNCRFANTTESGLSRTTAVGMYPAGEATCGAFDMSGNIWEWTLTDYKSGKSYDITGSATRVLRGGSWYDPAYKALTAIRDYGHPYCRGHGDGFRIVGVIPST